jgi:hypothetical protein
LKDRIEPEIQVPQVYFSLKFDETRLIYEALGEILVDAQEFHKKSFPLAKPIQRCDYLSVCRHNNANNIVWISGLMLSSMPMRA